MPTTRRHMPQMTVLTIIFFRSRLNDFVTSFFLFLRSQRILCPGYSWSDVFLTVPVFIWLPRQLKCLTWLNCSPSGKATNSSPGLLLIFITRMSSLYVWSSCLTLPQFPTFYPSCAEVLQPRWLTLPCHLHLHITMFWWDGLQNEYLHSHHLKYLLTCSVC